MIRTQKFCGRFAVIFFILSTAGCVNRSAPIKSTSPATQPIEAVFARPIEQAIAQGVSFLVSSQNPDGSWGTGTVSHGNEIDVSVPGSHHAFKAATTALCVMALREAGEHTAHDRGVEFLLSNYDVRRADSMLLYNIWAHCYVVQALAIESRTNHDPRLAAAVNFHLDRMARYETFVGGWNYYDFNGGDQKPASGATSFGTAAGLVALREAQAAGFAISMPIVQRGLHRLDVMRQPDGGYLYGSDYQYMPLLPANQFRGSMGRTQAVNFSMMLWKDPSVNEAACRAALDRFFNEHAAIEAGRKLNYPHESWYQTSGYYFYFDHYYTARLIELLGPAAKKDYVDKLKAVILPHQETDGSWWDYPMWDYHKPYGTAFAVMTLLRCK